MTTAPAAQILAPDAALPQRDALLDASAARTALALLGVDCGSQIEATLARVNYQVGKSVRAVYRAQVDGAPHAVAARMFRHGKSADAFARAREGATDVGTLKGIAHAAELDTVFWLFPNDRKIDTLRAVLASETPIPATGAAPVRMQLAAYAPEKSATLKCDADGRTVAYAKVAASYQAERDCTTYTTLRAALGNDDAHLRLPAPLDYDADLRTLWLEAIDGRRLADETSDDDLRALGAAVARFHRLPPDEAPVFDRFSRSRLERDAAVLGAVRPDVVDAANDLVSRLAATVPADGEVACLHGDLHPKNAIICGGRMTLIDVEDVAAGPAAADIGSLIASLVYVRTGGRLTSAMWTRKVGAFLDGYTAVRALPTAASLAWHTATALFVERASRSLTRVRPLGLACLSELLIASHRLLDRGLEL